MRLVRGRRVFGNGRTSVVTVPPGFFAAEDGVIRAHSVAGRRAAARQHLIELRLRRLVSGGTGVSPLRSFVEPTLASPAFLLGATDSKPSF